MNLTLLIGIVLIILGIILYHYFLKIANSFITGLVIGLGVGILITGKNPFMRKQLKYLQNPYLTIIFAPQLKK